MSASFVAAAALTFAASIHCVGMCGGFVLALAAKDRAARLRRLGEQLLLQAGKAASYAFLGALAGAFGAAFVSSAAVSWAGRVLALLAAGAIVAAGLTLLGLRARGSGRLAARIAPLWSQWLGPLLEHRPAGSSVVIGMAIGFLPCPLVYAGLAAAAATGSAAGGAATLAGVALGTAPALAAVALFGQTMPLVTRRWLARVGGVLLVVVGLVTAFRGVATHDHHAGHAGSSLPAEVSPSPASAPAAPAPSAAAPAPSAPVPAPPAKAHSHPHH